MKPRTLRIVLGATIAAALTLWSWAGFAQKDTDLGSTTGTAAVEKTSAETSKAWQPDPVPASRYRDIVDFNIFRSDRAALARQAQKERNPQPVVAKVQTPDQVVPQDPDAAYVLVGVVLRGPQQQAFIEDRGRGNILRITVPGEFSAGRLESIDTDGVMYRIDGEDRAIAVGSDFLGKMTEVAPAAEQSTSQRSTREDIEDEDNRADRSSRDRPSREDIERFRRERSRN